MSERWLPVVGYEGRYEISDLGRLRSLGAQSEWSRWKYYKGGIVKGVRNRKGYRQYCLRLNGSEKSILAHVLVAAAFIGPRPHGMAVCHNDGNGENNSPHNLRYDTPKSNQADRIKHGTFLTRVNGHPRAKLSKEEVAEIQASRDPGVALARKYGVTPQTISGLRGPVLRPRS